MNRDQIAPILGRVSSGLYIVTSVLDDDPVGMLCSFVEQASFSPPMVTVALAPERRLAEALRETNRACLNILSVTNQNLMGAFANPNNEDPFDGMDLQQVEGDLPVLSNALGYLTCEFRQEVEAGDHHVFLLEVVGGELLDSDNEPMIRVRRNGFNY